ncbi:glycoside hydrolase family 15 protein [Edaphobacter paludis]|uniref:Glycoside hydrolase family 15 protein n=1 Tax=Edaphobacter paludis TaxID=3035702 RepID=A0AAU7CZE8_9BACT
MSDLAAAYRWLDDQGAAFGSPGLEPRWTSSQKAAVSTAYSAASRIWFTVSHGILNEIYYPTIDRPQTRDMELIFTDGETFCHEEKRDFDYKLDYVHPNAPAIRVVAPDPTARYTVTKEFISEPHRPAVLMHVKITGDEQILARLKCYALLAPHLNGGGAGNSGRSVEVAGQRCLLAWKGNLSLAMGVSCGFTRSSCGYVGASDGYQDLATDMTMDWEFGQALEGNIAIMGEIDVTCSREFTVAIGLGDGHHAALACMMQTLATPYESHRERFIEQWMRVDSPKLIAASSTDDGRLANISHNVILTHEDKTYSGAFIASASIPWGASKGDSDLGGYHLVWTRDMVQSATALLACGDTETALRALVYLACTQRTDGSFAQNFWIDGVPYWSGIQLDEVAFPIILAWRLWKLDGLGNFDIFPLVERAAAFLVCYAPVTQQERWEETAGYSPSTLAAVISGLICAADIARARESDELASFFESYADWIEAHLDEWTTTTEGVLDPKIKCHYMRIRPPAPGEPFYNDQIAPGHIHIANRGSDEKQVFEAREIIDAGFLELVRYGIRRAEDPLIVDSLKVVDAVLKIETPFGPCWRRYNHDGYGQRKDGGPYEGWGQGRAWPLLTGERAHYELAAGRTVAPLISAFEKFSSSGGMLPEQIWDRADLPSEGMYFGKSAGSAQPLVWAHSEYIKLLRSATDGHIFDRISAVEERYAVPPAKRSFTSQIEIFQAARPVSSIPGGLTLRIVDKGRFRVVYTFDNWVTVQHLDSHSLGPIGYYADIPTEAGQIGKIIFTLCWPNYGQEPNQPDRWLGKNLEVSIMALTSTDKS